MDSQSLYFSLELVTGSGNTLNVEQRAALQTSLVILQKNYKFQRVMLWGKVLGLKADYFIAQGRGEDEMKDRKNLYSLNCVDWFLLPTATEPLIHQVSSAAKGRFTGDPSHVYEHQDSHRRGGDEEEEVVAKVNEESRLAVAIHHIEEEVSVVPRGAFVKSPRGLVQINRNFGGLSLSEAEKLDSFLHFSEPKNLKKKSILETSQLNPALDFLDVLSDDIPKGLCVQKPVGTDLSLSLLRRIKKQVQFSEGLSTINPLMLNPAGDLLLCAHMGSFRLSADSILRGSWSLQFECGRKVCVLRSLLWLGLTFYHVPMTPQHGYIYIGDGAKNLDLAFML